MVWAVKSQELQEIRSKRLVPAYDWLLLGKIVQNYQISRQINSTFILIILNTPSYQPLVQVSGPLMCPARAVLRIIGER